MSDLIAAIATGGSVSAIGVIRLSGDGAIDTVAQIFRPRFSGSLQQAPDRKLVLGSLYGRDGSLIDDCLCTVSRGPNSYTGEDTAELQCHGSPTVLRLALESLFAHGARQALAGEFTKRAFLNGRMDLMGAEAVIDLIHAETAAAAKNAAGQLTGAMSRRIEGVYNALADMLAHFQAVVDYPEEDIEPLELEACLRALRAAQEELGRLLDSFSRGRVMNSGIPAVILGRPNAGKSSLLNALVGYERAIVTDVPGTTRDTISERVELGGVLLRLTDTAGLRTTEDAVERLGVERARSAALEAELALVLVDPADPDWEILKGLESIPHVILVLTKADLHPGEVLSLPERLAVEAALSLSAKTGEGLDRLEAAVKKCFPAPTVPAGEILTNARQAEAVDRALESIRAAEAALCAGMEPDAALTETETALSALGELTGRTVRSDVTDRIFSRFCVGK